MVNASPPYPPAPPIAVPSQIAAASPPTPPSPPNALHPGAATFTYAAGQIKDRK